LPTIFKPIISNSFREVTEKIVFLGRRIFLLDKSFKMSIFSSGFVGCNWIPELEFFGISKRWV